MLVRAVMAVRRHSGKAERPRRPAYSSTANADSMLVHRGTRDQ